MIILPVLLAAAHIINPILNMSESFSYTTPCTLSVEGCETIHFILPVRATHWNFHQGQGERGLGVDTLCFITVESTETTFVIPDENGVLPEAGTFYITAEATDTISTTEPPHHEILNTVQISLRPDDSYIGYLYELLNTPFIMAPRTTPGGFNQADSRLGTDCAGLAVYGRRRMGDTTVHYLGPRGILRYLENISPDEYHLTGNVYTSQSGDTALAPERGDILHFRSQVSIFLEDRGIPGILDTEDLLIQSWFNGTHICRIQDNGFTDYPLKLYSWK
jgi:hypothetical protein